MGELVNINKVRKQVATRRAAARAAENRLIHGRSKAEKAREEARASEVRRDLDGHRIEPSHRIEPGDER
ncbi:MAG TPA: DUF4169 family protein [Xanthobacteraceae bacterium]|nr:DUF4169 family protein [Xanthobacteraceae bacterium]